jgi:GT2 family glycosyltransferase
MAIDNVVFCSALFRKSDWKRVGGYSEGLRHGVEDYDFWLKFLSAGLRITQLDETLFFYRVQPSSRTSRFLSDENKMIDTYARIFRNHLQFYSTHAETLFRHRFQLYRDKESLVKEIEEIRPFAIELHHQNTKLREQISALQHDGSIRRTAVQLLKLTLRRISPRLCTLVRDWYRAIRVRGASIMSAH